MLRGFFVVSARRGALPIQSIGAAYNTETRRPETRKPALDNGLRGFNRGSATTGTSDFQQKDLRLPAATAYNDRERALRPESLRLPSEVVKP